MQLTTSRDLDQIQFMLACELIQTTERDLGYKQRFRAADDDWTGIDPNGSQTIHLAHLMDRRQSGYRLPLLAPCFFDHCAHPDYRS